MARNNSITVVQLFRFMRLFGITLFSILEVTDEYVRALVAWEDGCNSGIPDPEEVQEVVWRQGIAGMSEDALVVAEHTYDVSSGHDVDRLKVDRDTVGTALGWSTDRVGRAISDLLKIRVDMIDDGEVTDGFQLHL